MYWGFLRRVEASVAGPENMGTEGNRAGDSPIMKGLIGHRYNFGLYFSENEVIITVAAQLSEEKSAGREPCGPERDHADVLG